MDLPIACTLDAAQMSKRVATIAALLTDALVDQSEIDGGVRTRFHDAPGVEARIRDLIEAESQCCAFLGLDLGRDDRVLRLDITGAPEARPVIEQFFAAT